MTSSQPISLFPITTGTPQELMEAMYKEIREHPVEASARFQAWSKVPGNCDVFVEHDDNQKLPYAEFLEFQKTGLSFQEYMDRKKRTPQLSQGGKAKKTKVNRVSPLKRTSHKRASKTVALTKLNL